MNTRVVGVVCLAGCLAVPACSNQATPPKEPLDVTVVERPSVASYFEDVTAAAGVDFTYRNGDAAGHLTLLETLGGGVALFDFDGDGRLDIFLTGGGAFDGTTIRGLPGRLYRNLGDWTFRDVTAAVGLDKPGHYSHGCAVADYDNDGWPDLLITGYGGLTLYHNEPDGHGGRRFADVTAKAGLTDALWSTSAGWGDLNGDGRPDLYVVHYVDWSFANHPKCPGYVPDQAHDICSPRNFRPLPDTLYLNAGGGTFRDASQEVGLRRDGKGLGVLIADLDDDGKPDVYVANDTTENFLYLNRRGRLEEVGLARGVACDGRGQAQGSMGVDAADCDGAGRFSLFVTNYQGEPHALYRALGGGQFRFASEAAGVAAIGTTFVGFGTAFLDFDRDGAEDLVIANGHITRHPNPPGEYRQRPVLFRNARPGPGKPARFDDVTARGGPYFRAAHVGRGLAVGDLDNDGRPDLVVSHTNEPAAVLRNVSDDGRRWLGVALVGRPGRDAVGARLTLDAGGQSLVRQVKGGGSYCSAGDPRVLFGLGDATAAGRLTVRWPSGLVQTWDGLAVDRYWVLTEGEAAAREAPGGRP